MCKSMGKRITRRKIMIKLLVISCRVKKREGFSIFQTSSTSMMRKKVTRMKVIIVKTLLSMR